MPFRLFHAFVNPVADQAGFTGTKPSDWNGAFEYANAADTGPSGTDVRVRETLTADRTYYVRTNGNDSNDGLANTAGGAFLTLSHAFVVVAQIDFSGFNVVIQVADGTYADGMLVNQPWTGGGSLTVRGNTTTPANCAISIVGSTNCFNVTASLPGAFAIEGFKLSSTAGVGIYFGGNGNTSFGVMEFGACGTAHIYINAPGCLISNYAAYTITGAATYHLLVNAPGTQYVSAMAKTLSGTFAFTLFAFAGNQGTIADTGGYTGGTITGTRYTVSTGGLINTQGGGANYFPGNVAGSPVPGVLGADGGYYA